METLLPMEAMESLETLSIETLESEHRSPIGLIVSHGLHRFP